MSSDEECDYMSDKFLQRCLPKDVRPGLTFSHSQQLSNTIQSKKKKLDEAHKLRYRPYRVVEAERREEGLSEAISKDNKGFAILQKMGYTPGLGIGKSQAGRVEPVPIAIKSGRGGLGRDAALKQIAAEKAAIRSRMVAQRAQWSSTEEYRARFVKKAAEKQVESDLRKSQRVCEQLDNERGYTEPAEVWFWPKKELPPPAEDEEPESALEKEIKKEELELEMHGSESDSETEFEPLEKLEMLTVYLRQTYYYCVWCGTNYNDAKDLSDECPGQTRDDH